MSLSVLIAVALLFGIPSAYAGQSGICKIFAKHPSWYRATKKTQKKWGVPVPVQMAIMRQESSFKNTAKNPKSSALGYAQALKGTWHNYEHAEHRVASRTNFSADSDFIGWYASQASRHLGISKKNAYSIYLAYYYGAGGYKYAVRHPKSRMSHVARKVQHYANTYRAELSHCGGSVSA